MDRVKPPIDGSTILVTGASSGIGRALAELVAPRADTLIIVARREERLAAVRDGILERAAGADVRIMPCDVASRAERVALLARIEREVGAVDCLINCAGFGHQSPLVGTDPERVAAMLDVNCEALTHFCQALAPGMVERGRGGILNVGSQLGLLVQPAMAVYSATKHYVDALTEALRDNLRGTGVVVTQLCPGPVRTGFADVAGYAYSAGSARDRLAMSPEECARAAIRGFEAGRALVVPDVRLRLVLAVAMCLPRPARRWISRRMAAATEADRRPM